MKPRRYTSIASEAPSDPNQCPHPGPPARLAPVTRPYGPRATCVTRGVRALSSYMETAALSVSAYSNAIWQSFLMLLDASSASQIQALDVAACVPRKWLVGPEALPLCFNELAAVLTESQLGVLIGWQRLQDRSGEAATAAARVVGGRQSAIGFMRGTAMGAVDAIRRAAFHGPAATTDTISYQTCELNPGKTTGLYWQSGDRLLFVSGPHSRPIGAPAPEQMNA